jgi:transcriptional regulator with XRE-family HTH domain
LYRLSNPELLRALARQRGYTAGRLAELTTKDDGTAPSRQLIEHLLSGRRAHATPTVATSIARALGVEMDLIWIPTEEHDPVPH